MHVAFGDELLESYTNINKWLHEQVMEPFYAPNESGKVPDLWDSVEEVFDDPLLKHVKMTQHAFQCYLGLWRALNVTKEMEYPLPPIARIVPLVVAIWNTLKGGGDTITKLDDICQERLGIRTESNVATARDLLNLGVVFHRCNQMISSKDPEEYPTLYHWRDAASHRSTMKRSLATLYTTLLEMAKGAEQEESVEMANCYLSSPEEPEIRRSNRKQPNTPSIRMPCVVGVSGYTPGKGCSVDKPSQQFVDRCLKCNGMYPAIRIIKAKVDESQKKAGRRVNVKRGKTKNKKPDQRRRCHLCGAKTRFFCFGCHRYLCDKPPKDGKDRSGKKHPSQFHVMAPILEPDGKIMRKKGKIVFEQQFGELTCYHIAHSDRWKEESTNGDAKKPPVSEDGKGESNNKQKKGKQHTVSADSKGEAAKARGGKRGKKRKASS